MTAPDDNAMRRDWDARAKHVMRLYVATWYAHSDETWAEGTRRDAAYIMERVPARLVSTIKPGRSSHSLPRP